MFKRISMYILSILFILLVLQFGISAYFLYKGKKLSQITYNGVYMSNNNTSTLVYNILLEGDSVAAGVGASSKEKTVASLLANSLSDQYYVKLSNVSEPGRRMKDLLDTDIPRSDYDLIVLIISSNDLFHLTPLTEFRSSTEAVLQRYAAMGKKVILVGPGRLWDATALPFPVRWYYKKKAPAYAQILTDVSQLYENIVYISPLDTKFAPNTLAKDHFHPNDSGHRIWFDVISENL